MAIDEPASDVLLLSPEEYDRRRSYLQNITNLTKSECIEFVRVLKNNNIEYSENSNGIFINIGLLPQHIFDKLEQLLLFIQRNRRDLEDRELVMSSLATEIKNTSNL